MKKSIILLLVIFFALSLFGCNKINSDQKIIDNKDNILLVDLGGALENSFKDICEVTQNINYQSNKRYKFIVLSESEAEKITSISDTKDLKEKILAGYYVIYPQTDKEKLNNFCSLFYKSISMNNDYFRGVTLKREMNFTLFSYYVQVIPSLSNSKSENAFEYIKSEIKTVISLDEPNIEKNIFLGLYISKAIPRNNDIEEIALFNSNIIYDKFDSFDNANMKKFTYNYDKDKNKILYSTKYEISKDTLEYFCPYMIVKDFEGKIKAIPFRNSFYVHTGVVYTLTTEIPIYTGVYSIPEFYIQEYVSVTFDYVWTLIKGSNEILSQGNKSKKGNAFTRCLSFYLDLSIIFWFIG